MVAIERGDDLIDYAQGIKSLLEPDNPRENFEFLSSLFDNKYLGIKEECDKELHDREIIVSGSWQALYLYDQMTLLARTKRERRILRERRIKAEELNDLLANV